ncbi:MAG TPA: D-alanyl-lipoteichoic acid biosynthesis protein DltD [Anaerolineales bacterium]
MKQISHLTAAIFSLCVLIVVLIGFNGYARSIERQYVNALAPLDLTQTVNGIALQQAALYQSDLLPFYGSSEITLINTPYQAEKFFATYPTGFTVFQVANLGAGSLTMAQNLAALGPDLKGKKVVISITPAPFTFSPLREDYYAGNYTRLHAYGLIFSPYLSMELKSTAAQRMLGHPKTLEADPFLEFTLNHMTDASIQSRVLYVIMFPLGALQTEVMWLQDHAEVILYIWNHHIDPNVQHIPYKIRWSKNFSAAHAEQKLHALSNPYGIEDWRWKLFQGKSKVPYQPGSGDAGFLRFLQSAEEWQDFKILLDVLQELGAKPLILSRPINGRYWEAVGVSGQAQDAFYTKLHAVVDPYHMTLVDYQQYTNEIYFSIDSVSHTSRYGWVYVDKTLNQFFHGNLH